MLEIGEREALVVFDRRLKLRTVLGTARVAGKVATGVASGTVVATSWGMRKATGIDRHVVRSRALNDRMSQVIDDLCATVLAQDAEIARLEIELETLRLATQQRESGDEQVSTQ